MSYQNDCDEKAKEYITRLPILTQNILTYMPEEQSRAEMKALKELFDSFAIVDEFNSFLIVDCYNEIKISLMKWERFADKNLPVSVDFKKLLDQIYEVMKDLYFYEIFGFFSTSVWPKEIVELPCRVFCGCVDGWQREPYLTAEGKVEYADVIRFEDPANKKTPLCITIDNPHLLEPREKCSLSDEQIKTLTDFVRNNEAIIKLHNAEIIDSGGFLEALQLKNKPEEHKAKYCIEYSYFLKGCSMKIPSKKYYVDMDDQSFWEAKRFYRKLMKEIKAEPTRDYEAFKICSLKILMPRAMTKICPFCGSVFKGDGNSTWPIYYRQDGEKHRCCDECNEKYIIASRTNPSLIMGFRKQLGIDYTEYDINKITNEQIIKLFPSKAVRDYLTKINWQFSERDRDILYRYLALKEEPLYEKDYVTIPFPFRSGDLVYVIGDENHIGVLCSCKDEQDFFDLNNHIKSFADWTDAASTRVEFLEPNGWFNHSHPQAFNLEYAQISEDSAKDNPYYSALLIASELIRGTNSSIECLQMYCEEYAKKSKK